MTNPIDSPLGGSVDPFSAVPSSTGQEEPGTAVRLMHRVEEWQALDALGSGLEKVSRAVTWEPLGSLLRGRGGGHALHPALTDLPIGMWTSASILDLAGGEQGRPAARLLTALGLVSVVPTAATGLAEWAQTRGRESRVASLHATLNLIALGGYAVSLRLRRNGRHRAGALTSLAAMTVAGGSGYLGGHLVTVRKTGSRDPAFDHDGVGPIVQRPLGG